MSHALATGSARGIGADTRSALSLVGIIGDVHQQHASLRRALDALHAQGAARLLCTGDIADGDGDFATCCDLLRQHDVEVVRGNHDRWLLAGQMRSLPDALAREALRPPQRAFLASLPTIREYETATGRLQLCHGLGDDDMATVGADDFGHALQCNDALQLIMREQRYRYVVCGHSHQFMVRRFRATTIINAGTLLAIHEPCFLLLDFERETGTLFDLLADDELRAHPFELDPGGR